jgi:hypothetical protein
VRITLGQAKNFVRGSLSNKKVRPVEVLAQVIGTLAPDDLRRFGDWTDRYASHQTRLYPPARILKYADLWTGAYFTTPDFASLIRWVARNLSVQQELLAKFIGFLKTYEISYLSGRYEDASGILDDIESTFGLSYWLIETKIALLQRLRGLEGQKEYSRSVIEAAPKTVTAYFAFCVSQRNEEATTIERFSSHTVDDVDLQEVRDATKLFLKSRLVNGPDSCADEMTLSTVLSVEASISVVDGYLALLNAFVQIVRRPEFGELRPLIVETGKTIGAEDGRMQKLVALASHRFSALPTRLLDAENSYCRGQFPQALKQAQALIEDSPDDMDALALSAVCCALVPDGPPIRTLSPIQSEILLGLTALASRSGSLERVSAEMRKLVQNHRTLPSMQSVAGHLVSLRWNTPPTGASSASAIFENSRELSPTHWRVLEPSAAKSMLAHCRSSGPSVATALATAGLNREPSPTDVDPTIVLVSQIWSSLYHSDLASALTNARSLGASQSLPWARFGLHVELYCLTSLGQLGEAFERAAHLCSYDEDLHNIVPLRTFLEGKSWDDLKHLSRSLSLPIVLDLFWHFVNESEHETTRRNAYDDFLTAHDCRRPSELVKIAGKFDRQELIYFLRNLCVPEVMDVSYDVYESSLEILDERASVCAVLAELDPERREEYSAEIAALTKYKAIQDALRDIDRSRVHVNTEAIARRAARELLEDFSRYKNLMDANVDSFGEGPAAPRSTVKGNVGADLDPVVYPDKEASALFEKIVASVKTEYLRNADHGLDAYLSMRVRHGSLSGHLRGPLEERRLIVSRTDDKYADNEFLASQVAIANDQERKAFYACFADFSKRYDSIIDSLTKKRLQIRTEDKPDGMFGWPVEGAATATNIIRRQVGSQTSFEDFLLLLLTALGFLIRNVSEGVRDYIASDVKADIEAAFESLRQSLEHRMSARVYASVNSNIADTIPIVQAAIARVAEWFVPVQRKEETAAYTLDHMVDVGIEAARNTHRGFSPNIERTVSHGVFLATTLWDFVEVLLTLFDNVYLHSGSNCPWIKVNVSVEPYDDVFEKIVIRVENEVRADLVTQESRAKLARIAEQMNTGDYQQHVNLEGGTGLLKLKRLVSRNPAQTLDFDFVGTDTFFVQLSLLRNSGRMSPKNDGHDSNC